MNKKRRSINNGLSICTNFVQINEGAMRQRKNSDAEGKTTDFSTSLGDAFGLVLLETPLQPTARITGL